MTSRSLNALEQAFVRELVQDPERNQTAAAKRAGYSLKSATAHASRMMSNPKIIEAIEKEEHKLEVKSGITQERVLQELAKIGFSNIADFADLIEDGKSIRDLPKEHTAALGEINIEQTESDKISTKKARVKLLDKRAALIDIGKHLGMWKDKIEVTGALSLQQLVEQSIKDDEEELIEIESKEIEQVN